MTDAVALRRIFHINVNCSSLERSLPFYRLLGFEPLFEPAEFHGHAAETALAIPGAQGKGALLAAEGDRRGTVLNLIEWIEPRNLEPPYENCGHLGFARLALVVNDLDGVIERLTADGVRFFSEVVQSRVLGGMRYICCADPDGAVVELLEFEDGRESFVDS
jgi:catechol 2,3-dioxygenase-like lactoylglutathione lyase family enzyme